MGFPVKVVILLCSLAGVLGWTKEDYYTYMDLKHPQDIRSMYNSKLIGDTKSTPCDNFHQFTCSGEVDSEVPKTLLSDLYDKWLSSIHPSDTWEVTLKLLYQECKKFDGDAISVVKSFGDWPILSDNAVVNSTKLINQALELGTYGVYTFFDVNGLELKPKIAPYSLESLEDYKMNIESAIKKTNYAFDENKLRNMIFRMYVFEKQLKAEIIDRTRFGGEEITSLFKEIGTSGYYGTWSIPTNFLNLLQIFLNEKSPQTVVDFFFWRTLFYTQKALETPIDCLDLVKSSPFPIFDSIFQKEYFDIGSKHELEEMFPRIARQLYNIFSNVAYSSFNMYTRTELEPSLDIVDTADATLCTSMTRLKYIQLYAGYNFWNLRSKNKAHLKKGTDRIDTKKLPLLPSFFADLSASSVYTFSNDNKLDSYSKLKLNHLSDLTIPKSMLIPPFYRPYEPIYSTYAKLGYQVSKTLLMAYPGDLKTFYTYNPLREEPILKESVNDLLKDDQTGLNAIALSIAFAAYMESQSSRGSVEAWEHNQYSHEQLFFMSYADQFCHSNASDQPNVNDVLQRVPEFLHLYECPSKEGIMQLKMGDFGPKAPKEWDEAIKRCHLKH